MPQSDGAPGDGAALAGSVGLAEELLDLARDAIMVRELEGGAIRYWNRGAERLYGWSREEALGRPSRELLRTRFPRPLGEILAELRREGAWAGELGHTARDGRRLVVDSRWTLRPDPAGGPDVFLEVNTDATARARLEAERARLLRRERGARAAAAAAHERAAALLAAVPDAIFLVGPDDRHVDANEAALRLSGYTREELRAMVPGDLLRLPRERWLTTAVRETGRPAVAERTLHAKDGRAVPIEAHVAPVALPDGTRLGLVVARDITERKRAEAAEQAVRERDTFLAFAAHELRTPLTSLRAFTQLLLRRMDRAARHDPELVRRALEQIVRQTEKLRLLGDRLLDVTRLEGGRLVLERRDTDLAALAREVAAAMQAQAAAHRLVVSAPPALRAQVDPVRLEQVLANLVANAIKYSPRGGAITVTVEAAAGDARLVVEDRGLGVPEEHRPHIFDRFYRAHEGDYRSGLGLGLYICRELVALHGGTLEAEFPDEGGSRFVVALPAAPAGEPSE